MKRKKKIKKYKIKKKMKYSILLLISSVISYNRNKALEYAYKHYKLVNHDCKKGRYDCTPYAYYGTEFCKYGEGPGDDANFVSQCLVEAGHPPLKGQNCTGGCGKVEPGSSQLGICLSSTFKWTRKCGKLLIPPKWVTKGDVVIFHAQSCNSTIAQAALVTVPGKNAKVITNSKSMKDRSYKKWEKTHPFYEWLHFPK